MAFFFAEGQAGEEEEYVQNGELKFSIACFFGKLSIPLSHEKFQLNFVRHQILLIRTCKFLS